MSGVLGTVASTIPGVATSGGASSYTPGGTFSPSVGSSGLGSSSVSGFADSALSVTSIAGVLVEALAVMVVISLVGVIIIAVVANRADPDPSGRRPQSVYFFMVSFVTVTTTITGSAIVMAAVLGLTAHHPSSVGHALTRLLLISALLTLVSAVLLAVHLRRGLILARADSSPAGPSKRVGQSYVSVVAFVAVLSLLFTAVLSIYLVFALAAPGTFGSFGGRGWTLRILIETVYLGAVAIFVAWRHSTMLTPGLSIWGSDSGSPGPFGPAPIGVPPAPIPPLA
jgi:hypothetical protein